MTFFEKLAEGAKLIWLTLWYADLDEFFPHPAGRKSAKKWSGVRTLHSLDAKRIHPHPDLPPAYRRRGKG
jgi:hypothetical protein